VRRIRRPLAVLAAFAVTALAAAAPPAGAQDRVPRIARGTFDARMTVPGTRTIYHRRWRLSPSCLGAACPRIRLLMQRSDDRYDLVALRRRARAYRGRVRTRSLCRGRLATRAGTISVALRVIRTVKRDMVSGRETIVTGIGGDLRVHSGRGVCPRGRHMGRAVRVNADRIDLPEAPLADFEVMPGEPSVAAGTNTVQFTDISSPAEDLVSRGWDFGDPAAGSANRASGPSVAHTYASPGNYRATLTVVDRFDQVASAVRPIDVLP
jgi:PKD domain-containing protein